jgi:quinol-cytochrome oxidoreductase complex cytochrome b subunit
MADVPARATGATERVSASPSRSRARRALDAIDERMGIDALQYPVPEHANKLGWSLGGLTAFTFVVLLVTGIYLAQFYNPMPEEANQSVRDITTNVWLGNVTRGVHFWAAQAMYIFAGLHMLRVFFHASYKRPREGNWLIGVSMFALVFLAIFTGTVLKWDQEGFEALGHNIELGELLGGLGFWFTPDMADKVPILVRLYVAHAVLIPGLIVGLVVWHALLVKRHRISPHPALPATSVATHLEAEEPFTHHIRRVVAFGLVALGVFGLLAVLFPPVVGPTPVEGIEVTKPLWVYWWMYTLENWFGLSAIVWGSGILFGLLILVPFVDRGSSRYWRDRKIALVLGALVVLTLVVLSLFMLGTTPESHM